MSKKKPQLLIDTNPLIRMEAGYDQVEEDFRKASKATPPKDRREARALRRKVQQPEEAS